MTMRSRSSSAMVKALRAEFKRQADPVKAEPMQIYMKSEMPYYGIKAPERRVIQSEVFAEYPLESFEEWRDTVLALWRGAKYREERYAAMELASDKAYFDYRLQLRALAIYEEMIVTGAWWDFVDAIAIESVGGLLRKYPRPMKTKMRTWSKSKDMWKRRTSILCQIKSREETDLDLLCECIERSIEDTDFFIRKGIGWALREYGKTDPRQVLRYVKASRQRLSGISKREAMKPVIKAGLAKNIP